MAQLIQLFMLNQYEVLQVLMIADTVTSEEAIDRAVDILITFLEVHPRP